MINLIQFLSYVNASEHFLSQLYTKYFFLFVKILQR